MEQWKNLNDDSMVFKGNRGSESKLRSLFDQALVVFLSEKSEKKSARTVPVLSGSGKPVDLFKLYWIVREKGGYDQVSCKNLWGCVAEHCGFDTGVVPSVKLAYSKYLSEFDHWLQPLLKDGNLVEGEGGVIRKLDLLSKELEIKFSDLFPSKNGCNEEVICKVDSQVDLEMCTAESVNETNDYTEHNLNNGNEISVSMIANDAILLVSTKGIVEEIIYRAPAKSDRQGDDDENLLARDGKNNKTSTRDVIQGAVAKMNGSDTTVASDKSGIEDVIASRMRKRESSCFSEMLNWIKHAAIHSNDPEIGEVPNSSKWKDHTGNEFWFQALSVREARLKKTHIDTDAEEANPQQKKQKMQPSMYEEEKLNNQPAEKLRCSKRIPASQKHILCGGCISCPTSRNNVETHQKKEDGIAPVLTNVEVSVAVKTKASYNQPKFSEPFVGALYQAEVPEWTGVVSKSDSKWLGTRMWPPEVEATNSLVVFDPIGKGRQSSCDCPFPQSTECNRFHIADERFKLKRELGTLFFRWRFDQMGEEVSLSWTAKEEERFKASLRSSASSKNKLWKNYKRLFPSKTRNMLVSYYFNVFLIKRRSYQNRVTPKDVDSDDDEKSFGCVGGGFGDIAVRVPTSRPSLKCSQNKVCTLLE